MPREQINYPKPFEPCESSTSGSTNDPIIHGESWSEPIVSVNWLGATGDHDGHAQVSIEVSRKYLEMLADRDYDQSSRGMTATVYSGVLARADLNRLVRSSRRARDQAYGRDE